MIGQFESFKKNFLIKNIKESSCDDYIDIVKKANNNQGLYLSLSSNNDLFYITFFSPFDTDCIVYEGALGTLLKKEYNNTLVLSIVPLSLSENSVYFVPCVSWKKTSNIDINEVLNYLIETTNKLVAKEVGYSLWSQNADSRLRMLNKIKNKIITGDFKEEDAYICVYTLNKNSPIVEEEFEIVKFIIESSLKFIASTKNVPYFSSSLVEEYIIKKYNNEFVKIIFDNIICEGESNERK